MESLQELREQLDEIDAQIVDLYQKRMDICGKVGKYKAVTGKPVLDRKREEEKIAAVTANITNELHKKGLTELYEQLMASSRELQYQILANKEAVQEKCVD